MKRFIYSWVCLAALFLVSALRARAQSSGGDHFNAAVYGNWLRISDSQIDLGGIGARFSVNVRPRIQLEAEAAYNFAETFSQGFSDFNGTITISQTQLRAVDGLFGPKFYSNRGPVRLFVTLKGGFVDFNLSTSPPLAIRTVRSTFQGLSGGNTFGVFYPGGGAEAFWGPFGLRVDIGDEMFFDAGAHNNLRISAGPVIRF